MLLMKVEMCVTQNVLWHFLFSNFDFLPIYKADSAGSRTYPFISKFIVCNVFYFELQYALRLRSPLTMLMGIDRTTRHKEQTLELKVLDVIMCNFLGLSIQVIINLCSPFSYYYYYYYHYLFIFILFYYYYYYFFFFCKTKIS